MKQHHMTGKKNAKKPNPRSERLPQVRVTPEEKAKIEQNAKSIDATVSDYIRESALRP